MEIIATIVSIVPFEIEADKPTIYPGVFRIPKGDENSPSVLHVKEASHFVYMGADRGKSPFLRVRNSAFDVARAIIEDFIGALIGTTPYARPGIFWVPVEVSGEEVPFKYPKELENAKATQRLWYEELVKMADGDWSKSNQNYRSITSLEVIAANKLGLKRQWAEEPKTVAISFVECPICRNTIDDGCIVCPSCHVIRKPAEYAKYEFAKA